MKPLNVLGRKVKIVFVDEVSTNDAAEFDPEKFEIAIEKELKKNPEELDHFLLHELGHAIFFRAGIYQAKIPTKVEEIIVDNFATVLLENFILIRK